MSENEHEIEKKHEVRIHIDRKVYESPNPTTGAALYRLGQVSTPRELFREVDGDREDRPISNDEAEVHLERDEHFYSEREFTIVVNGRPKVVTEQELSFNEIVPLAFDPPPSGPNIMFTITYRNGPRKNPEGTLLEGGTIKVREGMIFNVTQTDKS